MPIVLTTAFDPGDNDPGESYPKAKIRRIEIQVDNQDVRIIVEHGDDSGGPFVRGVGSKNKTIALNDRDGTDYTDFISQATLDGETLYDAFKRLAYAKVQELDAALAGTVE
jgi:hypothetical protein